ncbi:hypothetical protein RchiOBHm_Chr4g0395651 [Rosa chinensis]|uniref:ZZ-type domain-containing protein n=1 Tax=Rosa chinensis TaxID=74649 RepID=A0A2P6QRN9_ROSCH|nr:hypothetical protein RchiOBHm_Chr4g0395651 [Rosa chinensis]
MTCFTTTFSYLSVACDGLGCNALIQGRYFTCLDCSIIGGPNSFDLCSSCYPNRNYSHLHTTFVEKHVSAFPAANYLPTSYTAASQPATLNYSNEAAMKGIEAVNTDCIAHYCHIL